MGLDLDERHRSSVFSLLHQGSEARPRIQLCVAGVSDVVARVLLAHPVRRHLVRVQPLAVRSGRRLPSVHMFSNLGCALPCFSSSYFSIVSQSAIRGGLRRAVLHPARRLRLREPGSNRVRPGDVDRFLEDLAGSVALAHLGTLARIGMFASRVAVPVVLSGSLDRRRQYRPAPSAFGSAASGTGTQCCRRYWFAVSNTATKESFSHLTCRAPAARAAIGEGRVPAFLMGFSPRERLSGGPHVQVLPGRSVYPTVPAPATAPPPRRQAVRSNVLSRDGGVQEFGREQRYPQLLLEGPHTVTDDAGQQRVFRCSVHLRLYPP
eukprot:tig00020592_g11660.t2